MSAFGSAFGFPFGGLFPRPPTFALSVEAGATVTYEWRTDVQTMWSGKEQRISLLRRPRQRYEFTSILTDADQRAVMSELAARASTGIAYLLGLAYEEISLAVGTAGPSLVTHPGALARCDFAVVGQRAVVVSPSGEIDDGVIQSVVGDVITLDDLDPTVGVPGARVMPGMVIYLDETQSLARHVVNAGQWEMAAVAQRFRYGSSVALPGVGASLTEHDDLPIWDVGIQLAIASQPMHTGADLQDHGFSRKLLKEWEHPAWGRQLFIESTRRTTHWQWLMLFLHTVRGRWRRFLLPSGRPDLVPVGDASTGILTIEGDYVNTWWPSTAHQRIAIQLANGTVAYRTVTDATDNEDGTNDLELASAVAGAIDRVELLELCRLESDTVTVEWGEHGFECDLMARVVQDVDETLVDDGEPVELYEIESPLTGITRLTSSEEPYPWSGNTYTPLPMKRGEVIAPEVGEQDELIITLPVDHVLSQDLIGNGIPHQRITVTISRVHPTALSAKQIWRGYIAETTTQDQWLAITTARDLVETLSVSLPIAKGSRECGHQLYDRGCNSPLPTQDHVVDAVGGFAVELNATFTEANDWATGGVVYTWELLPGPIVNIFEKRSIVAQVGTTLTVDVPFRALRAGMTVTVAAGCDYTVTTCRDKHNNVANFGGHPYLADNKPSAPRGYGVVVQE